jgi:hypothetical protein
MGIIPIFYYFFIDKIYLVIEIKVAPVAEVSVLGAGTVIL